MTTKRNYISNFVLNTSQKFDDSVKPILYCHAYLSEKNKSNIDNQYIEIEYISVSNN